MIRLLRTGAAMALLVAVHGPARAWQAPPQPAEVQNLTVAVMPSQYFSADAASAARLTDSLRQAFGAKGWKVLAPDTVKAACDSMGLQPSVHYADQTAIDLGKKLNADLVVYPRLLALGIPLITNTPPAAGAAAPAGAATAAENPGPIPPEAIVHLRVLNVPRNRAIYFNQIGQEVTGPAPFDVSQFQLPGPTAQAATDRVLTGFFERVAGTREVLGVDWAGCRAGLAQAANAGRASWRSHKAALAMMTTDEPRAFQILLSMQAANPETARAYEECRREDSARFWQLAREAFNPKGPRPVAP